MERKGARLWGHGNLDVSLQQWDNASLAPHWTWTRLEMVGGMGEIRSEARWRAWTRVVFCAGRDRHARCGSVSSQLRGSISSIRDVRYRNVCSGYLTCVSGTMC